MKQVLQLTAAFIIVTALLAGGIWYYGYVKDETNGPKPAQIVPDTIIKVEPQNFPINELPDELFGKSIDTSALMVEFGPENLFSETEAPIPPFIDEIIFRESVVAFNMKVGALSPDEEAFKQSSQRHYNSADGTNGFTTVFETAPSAYQIIILGTYSDESDAMWMSLIREEPSQIQLEGQSMLKDFRRIHGTINEQPFQARVGRTSSAIAQ